MTTPVDSKPTSPSQPPSLSGSLVLNGRTYRVTVKNAKLDLTEDKLKKISELAQATIQTLHTSQSATKSLLIHKITIKATATQIKAGSNTYNIDTPKQLFDAVFDRCAPVVAPCLTPMKSPSTASATTPMGFLNTSGSNNCFFNATLKACLAIPAYREVFEELEGESCSKPYQLKQLTQDYESGNKGAAQSHISLLRFLLARDKFQTGQQHDAHEFFTELMSFTQAEHKLSITAHEKFNAALIGDGHPTQMLTLEPPDGTSTTVQAMVDQTFTMSQAGSSQERHLQLSAADSLSSFALRLNRDRHQGSGASSGIKRKYTVTNPWDPITVTINGQPRQLIPRSIVCHIGDSLTSGHYVTYTRDQSDVLFRHDDDNVQRRTAGILKKGMTPI